MPDVMEVTVYRFEELPERAKETARQWYRESCLDYDWHDDTFEDFARICEILGVSLKTTPVRLYGGGTRDKPRIYFSGFSSQGDGACFEARYRYARGAHREIRAYAPQDEELHRIADAFRDVQRRSFYQLTADATHQGRYYHEYSMSVAVERGDTHYGDASEHAENAIAEILRDLARWLYRALEKEYDYLTSDPVVDEAIAANGFRFTEAGGRLAKL